MTKEEKEGYLDQWGIHCMCCDAVVERKDMSLHYSITALEKYPDHAEPEVFHWYMACPNCVKEGELL